MIRCFKRPTTPSFDEKARGQYGRAAAVLFRGQSPGHRGPRDVGVLCTGDSKAGELLQGTPHHRCHHSSKEHPLSARVTCATCGCNLYGIEIKPGRRRRTQILAVLLVYWQARQPRNRAILHARAIAAVEQVSRYKPCPIPCHTAASCPKNGRCCARIVRYHISTGAAFVKAWNQLISQRLRYMADLRQIADETDNLLMCYRAQELYRPGSRG